MDEAERCHRLAYIAYGRLLATGTADEVVRVQQLHTFAVSGPNLAALADRVRGQPGVGQVTPFGNTLHVTGRDETLLRAALAPFEDDEDLRIEPIEATLEDVFISLMAGAADNFSEQ
jgi:ABC-2 type transport system ATP-binding protein